MHSIRRALALPLVIGTPLLVLLVGAACSWLVADRLRTDFDRTLLQKARALAALVQQTEPDGPVEFDFADELMPEFSVGPQREYFELWMRDGALIERSRSLANAHLPRPSARDATPLLQDYVLPDGAPGRLIIIRFFPDLADLRPAARGAAERASPLVFEQEGQERTARGSSVEIVLALARGTAHLEQLVREVMAVCLGAAIVLAGAILVLLRSVLKRGLRPLDALAAQVAAIGPDNLSQRVALQPLVVELAPVVERTNVLLATIESALARERRFSANVAHELRTPVAELKCLAEVGQRTPADGSAHAAFFADALNIADQMEHLVEQLLSLARMDAGIESAHLETVSLGSSINEVWASVAVAAEARRMTLRNHLPASASIRSDRAMLALVLRNLLANAVQYGKAGTTIDVDGQIESPQCWWVTLANVTEQLEPSDVAQLFERFWRKDSARVGNGNTGLGLSLVRAVARLLDLDVTAELVAQRLTITVKTRTFVASER